MSNAQSPPFRYINKQQGARHLLHAAIRGTFSGEDPFAIHVVAQSAEKVCMDLIKRAGLPDPLFSFIKEEKRREVLNIYRQPYNFLKHADNDSEDTLGVRDIVSSNDLLLFGCIYRYNILFKHFTRHMHAFMVFCGTVHPGIVNWDAIPGLKGKMNEAIGPGDTRGSLCATIQDAMTIVPDWIAEIQEDLAEVAAANERGISGAD